jgi:hypothetical protein
MAVTHKTASGKSIDMAALAAKNEKVRAISNTSMNARGDIIDSNNNIVAPVSQRVSRTYNKTTVTPTAHEDKTVATKSTAAPTIIKPTPDQPNQTPVPTHTKLTPDQPKPLVAPVVQEIKKEEPPVVFLEDMSDDEVEYFDEFDAEMPPPKADVKSKKK